MKNGPVEDRPSPERVAYLIAGYVRKTLTAPEREELDVWIGSSEENKRLFEELTDENNIEAALLWFQQQDEDKAKKESVLAGIKERAGIEGPSLLRRLLPYTVAAAVVLVAVLFIVNYNASNKKEQQVVVQNDPMVVPGREQAVLKLSDGRVVILDSAGRGKIGEGAMMENKGELVYSSEGQVKEVYNELSVPAGGQYKVVLSDGTKVWLNASSSLRYPVAFNGEKREVELSGEGYFEVTAAHEGGTSRGKFVVKSGSMEIEVLGTKFNINSYADEAVKRTTLVEGKIKLSAGRQSHIMMPGDQVSLMHEGIRVKQVDAEEVKAWKDGWFIFRDEPIESVASQIRRWYNIEVVYDGGVKDLFNASVKREERLERLLEILSKTGHVQFELKGKTLRIRP